MKSSSNSKSTTSGSSSKSKKNTKEREKRKSQSEKQENAEKGSPAKDSARKYAGIGPDSVLIYAEQSNGEELSDEACYSYAEDISYKLRYVIHDALIKARLSGRNHIISSDIDATFDSLNIEKAYGAPAVPNFIALADQNLYYLDDSLVNLVDIAEEECSYIQPGDVNLTRKWLPEMKDPSRNLKQYFETICTAIVSHDIELRHTALKDIRTNCYIGPIVEWFYNFCYFLLSKDITYDTLTLSALDLIKALESSMVASLIVSEKQLILIVRLILQRLLRSHTTPEVLKPMSSTLGLLCKRIPIRDLVLTKLKQKIPEIKYSFALPLLTIINALGIKAIDEIFSVNIDFFLQQVQGNRDLDYIYTILNTYKILCCEKVEISNVHSGFYDVFGDGIVHIWFHNMHKHIYEEKLETNWFALQLKLIKTRKYIPVNKKTCVKHNLNDVFPDNKFNEKKLQQNLLKRAEVQQKQTRILIGKRTLLIPVLKQNLPKKGTLKTCTDHSLIYLNL